MHVPRTITIEGSIKLINLFGASTANTCTNDFTKARSDADITLHYFSDERSQQLHRYVNRESGVSYINANVVLFYKILCS